MLPILGEAEVVLVEFFGFIDVEDAEDGDYGGEVDGHGCSGFPALFLGSLR